ncbi:helix-turn-helix transcriptional regulator [Atopococcus tabaci]|uniref:helix-turn-helix transcriptional regulator n=1 Tax=Atopococcus tabaci TaxID=269774 RepID=UPI0024099BBE|nr:helix-turn-helix transcriptional regulator [Atopococcus tabaci]
MSYQKLKDIRDERGETLDQVSKAVGITPQYYWMIENGKRRLNYELAVKIASHFGKEPDDIFLDSHLTTC